METILTLQKRLNKIVEISYLVLCNKIASKSINIPNEASFQMHFAVILKQIGQLFEFDVNDRFFIQLEDVQTINITQKSKNGKARCDIMLSLKNKEDDYSIAIELKYFKKVQGETITNNRFSLLCDIENLENYKRVNRKLECYEILYTDNSNYVNPNSSSYITIGDGSILEAGKYLSNGRSVSLENSYTLKWDTYENNHCFLKINV